MGNGNISFIMQNFRQTFYEGEKGLDVTRLLSKDFSESVGHPYVFGSIQNISSNVHFRYSLISMEDQHLKLRTMSVKK